MKSASKKNQRVLKIDTFFNLTEDGEYTFLINQNGELECRNANGNKLNIKQISSQMYYERSSKPKVITYSNSQFPAFSNPSQILRNFDFLCAVDTNTRQIRNRIISVSIVCIGLWRDLKDGTRFDFWPEVFIDFMDFDGKPERFAWNKVIELIMNAPDYKVENKYGLIVDSELGDIQGINSRNMPFYNEKYLPENFQLVFASSDKSGSVQNFMIRECDKMATYRLKQFEEYHKADESLGKFPYNYLNIKRISEKHL